MSKSEMTIGNGLSVLCFAALIIAAACYEKPEQNFVAAQYAPDCKGAKCEWCSSGLRCMDDKLCHCGEDDPPQPSPVGPLPVPPVDDVGDGAKVLLLGTKEIILHSRDNCPPCDSWWANERPKFEAAGWVVALHVLGSNENGRTPFFTVEVDGKQFELQGYHTLKQVEERIGR
jgi:hypothetical protein